jgi:nucleoside-diphosphate-sugar epimerase
MPLVSFFALVDPSLTHRQARLLKISRARKMSLPPSNGKTLLVTGINGYIASSLGGLILSKGYNLRGTSRSLASTEPLVNGAYAPFASRIEILEVPDITASGAFDKAVKCVHGIFHTASPINFKLQTFEEFVIPAVAGTVTLLNSALEHAGPQLEAVVVTSSAATIVDPKPPGYVFTEADFAVHATKLAGANRADGKNSPSAVLYPASKQAAERAVWMFKDEKKPHFAISTVHPTVTIGPPVQAPSSPSKLNATLLPTYDIFTGGPIPSSFGSGSFVDVRDVAFVHLWAYEHPDISNGERYIACHGYGPPQAIADILREAYPDRRDIIQVGRPGGGYIGYEDGVVKDVKSPPDRVSVSGKKAESVMGFKTRTFKESLLETAKVMERYL